jgi:hypothetical protein
LADGWSCLAKGTFEWPGPVGGRPPSPDFGGLTLCALGSPLQDVDGLGEAAAATPVEEDSSDAGFSLTDAKMVYQRHPADLIKFGRDQFQLKVGCLYSCVP